jgi:hypothetical protein
MNDRSFGFGDKGNLMQDSASLLVKSESILREEASTLAAIFPCLLISQNSTTSSCRRKAAQWLHSASLKSPKWIEQFRPVGFLSLLFGVRGLLRSFLDQVTISSKFAGPTRSSFKNLTGR